MRIVQVCFDVKANKEVERSCELAGSASRIMGSTVWSSAELPQQVGECSSLDSERWDLGFGPRLLWVWRHLQTSHNGSILSLCPRHSQLHTYGRGGCGSTAWLHMSRTAVAWTGRRGRR